MLAVCCVIAVIYRLQKRLGRKKSIDIASEFDAAYPKLQKIQQKAQQKEAQAKMNSVVVSPQHCKCVTCFKYIQLNFCVYRQRKLSFLKWIGITKIACVFASTLNYFILI